MLVHHKVPHPPGFPQASLTIHQCPLFILLAGETYCESKFSCPRKQHIDPARSRTLTFQPRVQCMITCRSLHLPNYLILLINYVNLWLIDWLDELLSSWSILWLSYWLILWRFSFFLSDDPYISHPTGTCHENFHLGGDRPWHEITWTLSTGMKKLSCWV